MDERQYGYISDEIHHPKNPPLFVTQTPHIYNLQHRYITEIIANKNLFNFQSHVRLRYLIHFWERVLNMFISLNGIHMARLTIGLTRKVLVT